jgi:hypothetical protein
MIGLGWQENGHICFQCLLADHRMDEVNLLNAFQKLIMPFHTIVTYGGHSFSYRFLKERWENGHDTDAEPLFEGIKLEDIQKDILPLKNYCQLDDLKKATMEKFLGFQRQEKCSGKELIRVYGQWERSYSEESQKVLLKHHVEDMRALICLLKLSIYRDFWNGDFQKIQSWNLLEGQCVFRLLLNGKAEKPIHYQTDFADIRIEEQEAIVTVSVYDGKLKHFLPGSIKDYYYLPAEDQAVHRSVACYVDKAYRQKATAATCYMTREGIFLPTPEKGIEPHFQENYQTKPYYIMYDPDAWQKDPEGLRQYLITLLNQMTRSPRPCHWMLGNKK